MCVIFVIITGFLAVSFYSNGAIVSAALSGMVCVILLIFFINNMIKNRACLFGNKTDCHKKRAQNTH